MFWEQVEDWPIVWQLVIVPAAFVLCWSGLLRLPASWQTRWRRRWTALGRRRGLSICIVGLAALAVSLFYGACRGLPAPRFHDEFSYLLAADTYAHGRLTNPPHPLWPHFESVHILQQPTYMSKFPPGQGLMLAFGQAVFGHPIAGVWLSFALGCMATTWMLQGWLPARWALVGGLLTALQANFVERWGQSYWGGGVALLGGALLFGACRRLLKTPTFANGFALAVGLGLLALTRPAEGLLTALPVVALFVVRLWRGLPVGLALSRIVLPVLLVLTGVVGFLAYHNQQVTGNWRTLPYQVYEATYASAPILFWQQASPFPEYRHESMRQAALLDRKDHDDHAARLTAVVTKKLASLARFGLEVTFTFTLATLPFLWRGRWNRFALLTIALLLAFAAQLRMPFGHYLAPIVPLGAFLVCQMLRQVRVGGRRRPGLRLFAVLLVLFSIGSTFLTMALQGRLPIDQRADIEKTLLTQGGRHLVVVRYRAYDRGEWVYNAADIDGSAIVWAREMGGAADRALLDHFAGRKTWLLTVGQPVELAPYSGEKTSPPP